MAIFKRKRKKNCYYIFKKEKRAVLFYYVCQVACSVLLSNPFCHNAEFKANDVEVCFISTSCGEFIFLRRKEEKIKTRKRLLFL